MPRPIVPVAKVSAHNNNMRLNEGKGLSNETSLKDISTSEAKIPTASTQLPANVQRLFRKAIFLLLTLAAITGLVLRFYHLQADPPHWGLVYNTDEAHYSYTAHNKILYGHWFVNEAKYGLMTPLFAFTQYLVATLAGGDPSIAT